MRKIFFTILLLCWLCGPAYATTRTACASGCDYATIQAWLNDVATTSGDVLNLSAETYGAIQLRGTQSGKSLTIHGAGKTSSIITTASGWTVDVGTNFQTGLLTVEHCTVNNTGASGTIIATTLGSAAAANLTFSDCNIGDATTNLCPIFYSTATGTGTLTFTNCAIATAYTTATSITLGKNEHLVISGGSITTNTRGFVGFSYVALDGTTTVNIDGVTIDITREAGSKYFITPTTGGSVDTITVNNCTISSGGYSGGLYYEGKAASVNFTSNTITLANVSTPFVGIKVGTDLPIAAGLIQTCNVSDNTINFAGSGTNISHGILIGKGVLGGTVLRNKMYNCNDGLVVKSKNVTYDHCLVSNGVTGGLAALYIRGGINNTIKNCTFYSAYGHGIEIDTHDAGASETVDVATAPSNLACVAVAQTMTAISAASGSMTVLATGSQPLEKFKAKIVLQNPSGSNNLYEGVTTFTITGTINSSSDTETVTFTSTSGNKAVGAAKYRYKCGTKEWDSIQSVTVTNYADGAITASVGGAGVKPVGNTIENCLVVVAPTNKYLIQDDIGTGDGNADGNTFDHNCYYKTTGDTAFASLNYGTTPPTIATNLAGLKSDWAAYGAATNDANSISVNPGVTASWTDFSLPSNSPLVDTGASLGSTTDILSHIVPNGPTSLTDIGAYEYQYPSSTTTLQTSSSTTTIAVTSSSTTTVAVTSSSTTTAAVTSSSTTTAAVTSSSTTTAAVTSSSTTTAAVTSSSTTTLQSSSSTTTVAVTSSSTTTAAVTSSSTTTRQSSSSTTTAGPGSTTTVISADNTWGDSWGRKWGKPWGVMRGW